MKEKLTIIQIHQMALVFYIDYHYRKFMKDFLKMDKNPEKDSFIFQKCNTMMEILKMTNYMVEDI